MKYEMDLVAPAFVEPSPAKMQQRDCEIVGDTAMATALIKRAVVESVSEKDRPDAWRFVGLTSQDEWMKIGYSQGEVFELAREISAAGPFTDEEAEVVSAHTYYARRCRLRKSGAQALAYSSVVAQLGICLAMVTQSELVACVDSAIVAVDETQASTNPEPAASDPAPAPAPS